MTIGSIGFGSYDAYKNSSAASAYSSQVNTGNSAAIRASVRTEDAAQKAGFSDAAIRGMKRSGQIECTTCANRTYQDGSDEQVSFKSAAHISPEAAASRVRGHEQEHVSNAYDKAKQDNGRVLQAAVSIHTATCPECGRTYVSGGTTTTKIAYKDDAYGQNAKKADEAALVGANVDYAV